MIVGKITTTQLSLVGDESCNEKGGGHKVSVSHRLHYLLVALFQCQRQGEILLSSVSLFSFLVCAGEREDNISWNSGSVQK